MKKALFFILMFLGVCTTQAQELYCHLNVVAPSVQGSTTRSIFTTLQQSLLEFVNNTNWTNNVFERDERIECSIYLTITEEINSGEFKGTLQVQAQRPVYGTSYNTVTLNFIDNDIQFKYIEYDKIEFNENLHLSNLSSIIAYYVYLILGIDYDTFAPQGGTDFFRKAQKIVMNAQNETEEGWKPYGGSRKNRYWIIDNILNSQYSAVRSAYYKYHRLGLDRMAERPAEGRLQIYESLLDMQKVYRDKPDPYLTYSQLFFDAKADEIVNVFSQGAMTDKVRAYNVLAEIDNSNESKYRKIKESSSEF